ncbi:MAG: hypothetical protein AAFY63_18260 [Cyanobacteria bacterium J06643_13]
MSGKITYFKTDDFEQRGEFNQFHSECKLNNLVFRKGDTLKHHDIKQVLDTCNKYNSFDINTLIIKGEEDLTIWIEHKSQRPVQSEAAENKSTERSPASQQSMPTKVVTKRYRGQVYEETVIDWAAVQQVPSKDKARRKYRGNYID